MRTNRRLYNAKLNSHNTQNNRQSLCYYDLIKAQSLLIGYLSRGWADYSSNLTPLCVYFTGRKCLQTTMLTLGISFSFLFGTSWYPMMRYKRKKLQVFKVQCNLFATNWHPHRTCFPSRDFTRRHDDCQCLSGWSAKRKHHQPYVQRLKYFCLICQSASKNYSD